MKEKKKRDYRMRCRYFVKGLCMLTKCHCHEEKIRQDKIAEQKNKSE